MAAVAVAAAATVTLIAQRQASSHFAPGERVWLDAHNCYNHDEIDRALEQPLPISIEEDLNWYQGRSVVSHSGEDVKTAPDLETYFFDKVKPIAVKPAQKGFDQTSLMLMGGVARSLQIAGSLETMLDVSVRYSNERVAFEKKISKFQAVQHNLAKLAGEAAAALAAASSAADAVANSTAFDESIFLEAAAAKIRCAEAAEKGAAIAHQVHGAIGFTKEHILHRYTMRALAWREDFGNESHWAVELGKLVAARGADELWPLVASR